MHRDMLILVCHAADGHFADGDRAAIRSVLDRSDYIAALDAIDTVGYVIVCRDGGHVTLHAPGLETMRSFHRMTLYLESNTWTSDLHLLVFALMKRGGFGLMDDIELAQFIVTQPEQVSYYPWLPQPPLLVRDVAALAQALV
jgi:hypothetical protein